MKIILASVAALFATLAVTAGSANADPDPFGGLGCSCDSAAGIQAKKSAVKDQVDQGIQNGLGSLHVSHGS